MIAEAPLTAASRFLALKKAATAYITTAKVAAVDGLTWAEFGELLVGLLRLAVKLADTLDAPGAERKALVLEAAAALFDAVADRAVPTVLWPMWILARPSVRSLVLAIASGAVEQLLPLVRSST